MEQIADEGLVCGGGLGAEPPGRRSRRKTLRNEVFYRRMTVKKPKKQTKNTHFDDLFRSKNEFTSKMRAPTNTLKKTEKKSKNTQKTDL